MAKKYPKKKRLLKQKSKKIKKKSSKSYTSKVKKKNHESAYKTDKSEIDNKIDDKELDNYLKSIDNIYKNDLLLELTEKKENEDEKGKTNNNINEEKINIKGHKKKHKKVTSQENKSIEDNENFIPKSNINNIINFDTYNNNNTEIKKERKEINNNLKNENIINDEILEISDKKDAIIFDNKIYDKLLYKQRIFILDKKQPKEFPNIINYRCHNFRKNNHISSRYFCHANSKANLE